MNRTRLSDSKSVSWTHYPQGGSGSKVMHDGTRSLDRPIYHRLQWSWARKIFENGTLRLGAVQKWPDPYERWWCEGLFGRNTPLAGVNAYALCWTTSSFDEPAWRMFGCEKGGPIVRVGCKVRALLEAATRQTTNEPGSWFVGTVRYKPAARLEALATEIEEGNHKEVARTAATMLLHKRNAFRFEREVRLLFLDRGPAREAVYLPIDTHAVVSDVMTSPHASPAQHEAVRKSLRPFGVKTRKSLILAKPIWPGR